MPAVEIARGFGLAAIALTVGALAFASLACLLVLVIMAAIVVQIVYRYLLDDPIAWVLDITIFLLVFIICGGAEQ